MAVVSIRFNRSVPEVKRRKTYRTTKRIRQTSNRRRSHPSPFRKPHVAISRRCREDKGLRHAYQYVAEHDDPEDAAVGFGACISNPVAQQQEDGGDDDGVLGAAVQEINSHWAGEDKGEEEASAQPVYCCF